MKTENRSDCGCEWIRHPDFGDVIVRSCAEHESNPVNITRCDLGILAGKVARREIDEATADALRADLCMKHGPALVRELDALYEQKLKDERFIEGDFR